MLFNKINIAPALTVLYFICNAGDQYVLLLKCRHGELNAVTSCRPCKRSCCRLFQMVAAVAVAAICSFQFIGAEGDPVSVLVIGDIKPGGATTCIYPIYVWGAFQHFFIIF